MALHHPNATQMGGSFPSISPSFRYARERQKTILQVFGFAKKFEKFPNRIFRM
jgi:hypothetical protein